MLRRTTQRVDCVHLADLSMIGAGALTRVLTAARRGAVRGKDGLSFDLNDSTSGVVEYTVLSRVVVHQKGQHRDKSSGLSVYSARMNLRLARGSTCRVTVPTSGNVGRGSATSLE